MNDTTPQTTHPSSRTSGLFGLLYAIVAYVLFLASFGAYWVAFLADRWVPVTVDRRPGGSLDPAWAVTVDLGLVLFFGLQHSVMARPGFKRWWTRLVPHHLERSTYVLLSSLALGLLMALWQPVGGAVWSVESAAGRTVLWTLFGLGLPLAVLASFQIDHFGLFGLRQPFDRLRGREPAPPKLVEPALYRVVRHPIQVGVLLLLWATPEMSVGHLLLAASMTLYIAIGLVYEERDLVTELGEAYRDYRGRVGGLVPGSQALPAPLRSGRFGVFVGAALAAVAVVLALVVGG